MNLSRLFWPQEHLSLKKYIVDIVTDTTVTPETNQDGEERQKARKKAKKLRTRMNSRWFFFFFLPLSVLCSSLTFFPLSPFTLLFLLFLSWVTVTHMAKGQHGICVRALWVTRRWRAEALCILAVRRATLMSLIYGHFVWLGRKKWESIWKAPSLSPVKSFSPNWLPLHCQNWSLLWCTMVC